LILAFSSILNNLPEGSEISTDYQSHTYRWTLTYRGGARRTDLVLKNQGKLS